MEWEIEYTIVTILGFTQNKSGYHITRGLQINIKNAQIISLYFFPILNHFL